MAILTAPSGLLSQDIYKSYLKNLYIISKNVGNKKITFWSLTKY